MRNKYAGKCFRCNKDVPVGKGFFQRVNSKKLYKIVGRWGWIIRCEECVGKGNH